MSHHLDDIRHEFHNGTRDLYVTVTPMHAAGYRRGSHSANITRRDGILNGRVQAQRINWDGHADTPI